MAQTGYTPISLYYSSTASATPTAGNLVAGELAINTADGKLFYKDSSGVVQTIASKGTGTIGGSTTQVQYNNNGAFAGSSNFVFDGTNVGIGTSSPAGILEVKGTNPQLFVRGSTGVEPRIRLYSDTTNRGQVSASSTYGIDINSETSMRLFTNGGAGSTTPVIIDTAGNMAIGKTGFYATPSASRKYLGLYGSTDASVIEVGTATATTSSGIFRINAYSGSTTVASIQSDCDSGSSTAASLFFTTNNGSGNNERMRITSAGNVGIGTSSPAAILDVTNGASPASRLRVGVGAGAAGTLYSTLAAGDYVSFETNAAERMRIDSSGNVGIGTTTPSALGNSLTELTVKAINTDKYANLNLIGVRDVGQNQNGVISFWNNFSTLTRTAYIQGTNSLSSNTAGELSFVTKSSAGALTEQLRINSTGALALQGASTSASGVGITFPATQSASSDANTLDDYEEGTWTPTDASGAGLTFTVSVATYTKIGRLVTVSYNITYPSTASGASAIIGGLPFQVTPAINNNYQGGVNTWNNNSRVLTNMALGQTTQATFRNNSNNTDPTNANLSGGNFRGVITYETT